MGNPLRSPGREHIPDYPKGFLTVHILQLLFSIILLGTTVFTLVYEVFIGNILMLLSSLASLVVSIWLIVAHTWAPLTYNYWACLVLDVVLFIFFLISFAVNAAYAVVLSAMGKSIGGALGAMAIFGAFNCIMFFCSLIIDAVVVSRHRRAGLGNRPGQVVVGFQASPNSESTLSQYGQPPAMVQRPTTMPQMQQQHQSYPNYPAPAYQSQYGTPQGFRQPSPDFSHVEPQQPKSFVSPSGDAPSKY